MAKRPLVVTGAGGRIGRLLRRLWPENDIQPIWLTRQQWNILAEAAPVLPQGAVVLDLAGVTSGDFAVNAQVADRVARATAAIEGRLIYASSASVYAGGPLDMGEETPPAPPTPYGNSKLAAEAAARAVCPDCTLLRIGNIAGADALLGVDRPQGVVLDPVPNGQRGPVRSYIGPNVLAQSLFSLCNMARSSALPDILNLCQPGPVAMADLLDAAHKQWRFGAFRDGVIAQVTLSGTRLQSLITIPPATAQGIVSDLNALGGWP